MLSADEDWSAAAGAASSRVDSKPNKSENPQAASHGTDIVEYGPAREYVLLAALAIDP